MAGGVEVGGGTPAGEGGVPLVLIDDGWDGRYVPSGHLIYTREDGIRAVGFDLASNTVLGDPVRASSLSGSGVPSPW